MNEVLAGDGFKNAVRALGIQAKKTYSGKKYEVWEIDNDDLYMLMQHQWAPQWGWCRCSTGCNITWWPTATFTVHGKEMIGWYRENDNHKNELLNREYDSLTDYLCSVIGASTESNVCSVAVDLAKLNLMTMAELFTEYEG